MLFIKWYLYILPSWLSSCGIDLFIFSLFLYFFQVHPYLKGSFPETFFPSFCSVGGFLNQLSNTIRFTSKYDITMQTNVFLTRNERILRWRQTLFVLDMDVFHAEDEHFSPGDQHIENTLLKFGHTHTTTCCCQQLPNITYVEITKHNLHVCWDHC